MKRKKFLSVIGFALKILPLTFWLALIFAFDEAYVAFLTLICVGAHELGHIAVFISLSRTYRMFAVGSGLRLSARGNLSYREEMLVALGGPMANVLLFLLATPFIALGLGEYAKAFGIINLFTAISNLLLIEGYDGYRIAECLIHQYTDAVFPYALLRSASFLLSAMLCILSIYLIRSFDGGYWVFFIFLFALLRAILGDSAVFPKKRSKKR